MTQPNAGRFQETDKYVAYLRTPEGRLRLDLAWTNLLGYLPAAIAAPRALDVGGGNGTLTLRLAALGYKVDLLDHSEPMLAQAGKEAAAQGLSGRISFRQGDVRCLAGLFEPSSFDLVACHNLLEYVEEPSAVLSDLAQVVKKEGKAVVSLLVRNRYGEVLKAAIKGRDLELAEATLSADTVLLDSLYGKPVRVFDAGEICQMAEQAGLELLALRGVRVAADYLGCEALPDDAYRRLLEFELRLGAQPQFAAIARYLQLIVRAAVQPAGGTGK